jgi:sulfate/thiosulfate transport system permease protein
VSFCLVSFFLGGEALRPAAGRWGLRATAIVYLGAMIVLPVIAVVTRGMSQGLSGVVDALSAPGAMSSLRLTLIMATLTAVLNAVFGTLVAYVLVRFEFPGKTLLGMIVDLPLAIPTLVTGVMLSVLYGSSSAFGSALQEAGLQIIFAPPGILLALLFVTLPFVIRTVQPVLLELDEGEEEAAYLLGARGGTVFRKVILPALRPAITAGALLTFARALGEFGSIVIVSGNLPGTLTSPVYIFQLTSQFRYEEAAAVATVLFAISFLMVLVTDRLLKQGSEAL